MYIFLVCLCLAGSFFSCELLLSAGEPNYILISLHMEICKNIELTLYESHIYRIHIDLCFKNFEEICFLKQKHLYPIHF